MRALCDLDVAELVHRVRELEAENARLRTALAGSMCGNAINPRTTCQLVRGHGGLHAWRESSSDLVIRWG